MRQYAQAYQKKQIVEDKQYKIEKQSKGTEGK